VFLLHNPYSKKNILIDELYVEDMAMMTARQIWEATTEKLKPYKDKVRSINYVYDSAALWFANEIGELAPSVFMEPADKASFGIDGYITLVRNVMRNGYIEIADSCPKTIWEHENYIKDDKGRIPKDHDHNINALQYALGSIGYDYSENPEKIINKADKRRGYSIESELNIGDPYAQI
jgi:hypothetical protein